MVAELTRWVTGIGYIVILVGTINLLRIHGRRIAQKRGDWIYSGIILGSMFLMFFACFFHKSLMTWLYDRVSVDLGAAIMCFVGFYFYSAMYRTFKIRNVDALATILACVFMLFAQAPATSAFARILADMGLWLADVPGMGAWRGLLMSAALGMFALAIRAAAGLEKAYMGGEA